MRSCAPSINTPPTSAPSTLGRPPAELPAPAPPVQPAPPTIPRLARTMRPRACLTSRPCPVATIHQNGERHVSAILFYQYLVSIITIPPYIFVYLLIVKNLFE